MASGVKHKYVSAKADGPDASKVRPSNWNDTHDVTVEMTNKSGVSIDAGTVVVHDPTTVEGVKTTVVQGEQKRVFVAKGTVADNVSGAFYSGDVVDVVKVQNAVSVGQWLRTSITAGRAEGIPIRTGSAYSSQGMPAGAFGIALTAFAGPGAGTVKALLFSHTVAPLGYLGPSVPAAATLIVDASATIVPVTGQTPINTISGRYPGQPLILLFTEPGFVSTSSGAIVLNGTTGDSVDSLFPAGSLLALVHIGDAGTNTHQEVYRSPVSRAGRVVVDENFSHWAISGAFLIGGARWQGEVAPAVTFIAPGGRVTLTGPEAMVLANNGGATGSLVFKHNKNPTFQCGQCQLGSTAGNRRFGFGADTAQANYRSGEPDDGVYFRHSLDGNYIAVCRASNVESVVDTAIAAATPTDHDFAIVFETASAKFYIDGVLKATITSNIPTADLTVFWSCSAGTQQFTYIHAEGKK